MNDFFWVALPKASGAAIQLLLNLFLVRSFGPEQYGMVAVCLTIIILSDAILGSAFDVAVLRHASLESSNHVRSLQFQQAGLLMKPVFGLIVVLPLFWFGGSLSIFLFHTPKASHLLFVTVVAVFGLMALRSIQAHFQVSSQFRRYGVLDIGHNTLRYGGTCVLLLLHLATPMKVVALYALAPSLISLILLSSLARPLVTVELSREAFQAVFDLVKSYLPTASIGSITSRMDLFIVSSLAGVVQAGIFAAAQTLILAPQLIGMYIGVVFAPRIMPLYQAGQLRPMYNKFQKYALIACMAAYLVAVVSMNSFVLAFLPASFRSAAAVALVLLPAGLASLVNFPWTISFLMFMRPKFLLMFDLVGLPVLAIVYWLVVPAYGPMGAAAVTSGYAVVKTVVIQMVAQKLLRQKDTSGSVALMGNETELQLAGKVS